MNNLELKIEMLKNNVNSSDIAEYLNITQSAFSKKINGVNEFSRRDILKIKTLLKLTPERMNEIFFESDVDLKSTRLAK